MDAEHKEGLLIIAEALLLLNDRIRESNRLQGRTNELLEQHGRLLSDLSQPKWNGGPK